MFRRLATAVALLTATVLAGCSSRAAQPTASPPPAPPVIVVPPPPPVTPEPPPAPPQPIAPMPPLACVAVRGLEPTADGFIQVGSALADESGRFALEWVCREEDWRLRLQRCSSGCVGEWADESSPVWQDVAELALGALSADEVLVFGPGACTLAPDEGSLSPPAAVVARARRSNLEKLPALDRAWLAVLEAPFEFREISPSGVICLNPDYGL